MADVRALYDRHGQKLRYLIVGGWNTLFGYGCFVVLQALLGHRVNYLFVLALSYVISITNSYLGYKFIVFRTKGNYLREYLRTYLVYSVTFLVNAAVLAALVEWVHLSPIIGQAIATTVTVVMGYVAHHNFTFASPEDIVEHD